MKTKTLLKIAIASAICAPACTNETGVVIDKEDIEEEKALFVNLIRKNKVRQKPLRVQSNEVYDADRKLFFDDSTYMEPFEYALPGDTISFYNAMHRTYLYMNGTKNRVRDINGITEREIIEGVRKYQR